ncbi:MAG: tRNA (adenosine(37)-N6)-threonylcarbamoyltransferase complex ATPase subunit type 1 TsaE [Bacillota bacterium]|nr:tRNA (adenosine(37)-N6)-threonylcarbamoyltransferase complex ATPase subunit type 1 TsaE [Bacillota bacterium]
MLWQLISPSPRVTELVGEKLGRLLTPGDVVSLVGELGAGKTVFVHGVARGLGVTSSVSSPSFILIQEYEGKYPVFHCDFFRLESYQELEEIGWDEYRQRKGIILIEWGNRIPEALPQEYLEIAIACHGNSESARLISFYPRGSVYEAKVKELRDACGCLG